MKRSVLIIFLVLIIDQAVKLWVKTHMYLGQEFRIIGDWFIVHFTENYGMAFGMEFGGESGKLLLSLFRLVFVIGIIWYVYQLTRKKYDKLYIITLSLIIAGAIGNLIDSAFYGMLFNGSEYQIATLFPVDGGYSSFLHGRVVDMLYFPVVEGNFPSWIPFWGGQEFIFFRPIFNVADSAISIGVFMWIIFQKRFMKNGFGDDATLPVENSNSPSEQAATD
ncbi:MAG: lipoprotein signal peptidase [Bacteroidota bacterium]